MQLPWKRFVALGDSLTEGVGDPRPDGSLHGWADRMAAAFREHDPSLGYTNLAERGLRTSDVRDRQLPLAIELRPDLAAALSGMNDLLDPAFDPARYERVLDDIVEPLRALGAKVLMSTFPDITVHSPLPKRMMRPVRRRLAEASSAVRRVAARHEAVLLDVESLPEAAEREVMSVDRLHPGPRGHLLLAQAFTRLLEEDCGLRLPMPAARGLAGKITQARWLMRQFDPREVGRFVYRFYLARPRRSPS